MNFRTVFDADVGECRLGRFADVDVRAGAGCQFVVTGDKIGVQVSLKDVANLQALLLASVDVDFDIALRVDHGSHAIRAEHIRGVGQTT